MSNPFNSKGKGIITDGNLLRKSKNAYNSSTISGGGTSVTKSVQEVIYSDYVTDVIQIPFTGLPVIDGTTLSEGDTLLLVGEPDLTQNRVYTVSSSDWTVINNSMASVYRIVITKGIHALREYFIVNKEDVLTDPLGALVWGFIDLGALSNRLTVTLNKTQLEALDTTPIELLPQRFQGFGDEGSYLIRSCAMILNFNTVPYQILTGSFAIRYDSSLDEIMIMQDAMLQESSDKWEYFSPVIVDTLDIGSSVSITKSGALTLGDSTVDIVLDFTIVGA